MFDKLLYFFDKLLGRLNKGKQLILCHLKNAVVIAISNPPESLSLFPDDYGVGIFFQVELEGVVAHANLNLRHLHR